MGSLGNGDLGVCRTPAPVLPLRQAGPIIEVAAGRHHSMALSLASDVYVWGMCGASECDPIPRKQAFPGGRASAIGAGDEYCAALTPAGAVAWGGPRLGSTPSLVVPSPGAARLACGAHRLLLINAQGAAHLSGPLDNSSTHTGTATSSASHAVIRAHDNSRFIDVGAGASLYATLSSTGRVHVFGDSGTPLVLPDVVSVARFTGSPAHVLAVDTHGRLTKLAGALHNLSSRAEVLPLQRWGAGPPYVLSPSRSILHSSGPIPDTHSPPPLPSSTLILHSSPPISYSWPHQRVNHARRHAPRATPFAPRPSPLAIPKA